MDDVCRQVNQAIRDGVNVVVSPIAASNQNLAPIPALLAVSRRSSSLTAKARAPRSVSSSSRASRARCIICGAHRFRLRRHQPHLAFETLDDLLRADS